MTPANLSGLEVGDPIVEVNMPSELSANAQVGEQVFNVACAEYFFTPLNAIAITATIDKM